VTSGLALQPHERVLAAAQSTSELWYVGTNLALHLPTGGDPEPGAPEPSAGGAYRRVGWEDVERADWQGDTEQLSIVEVTPFGEPEAVTTVRLDEPHRLLELIRERVTSSVVCRVYAQVRDKSGLTVIGRRSPAGHGPISWSYLLSPGLDPDDPAVVLVAEETLAAAQRDLQGL
jgi:hypothetical protein